MLEVYLSGIRFRKKLDTLIQEAANGLIGPKEIEAFLKSGAVTLEGAEEMLNSQRNAQRGGLAHHLDGLTLEWVLDGLLGTKALQKRMGDRSAMDTLLDYLYRHAGMNAGFLNFFLEQEKCTFDSVGDAFAGWLISVEYVHVLREELHLQKLQPLCVLSPSLRKTCERLLGYLRERYPEIYEEKAQRLNARLEVAMNLVQSIHPVQSIDIFPRTEISPLPEPRISFFTERSTTHCLEAKALPAVLGHSRLQVRLKTTETGGLENSGIRVGLRVPGRSDIQLSIKEAIGALLVNQQVSLSVDGDWVEVFFALKGEHNEWVQVEIFDPESSEAISPFLLPDYFAVFLRAQEKLPTVAVNSTNDWQAEIDDPAIRDVFLHLQIHGTLTELELIHLLGSPRSARRFTRDFDELVQKVPFSVRIETNSSGKRYVRQDR
jgi:hypothetical protein